MSCQFAEPDRLGDGSVVGRAMGQQLGDRGPQIRAWHGPSPARVASFTACGEARAGSAAARRSVP